MYTIRFKPGTHCSFAVWQYRNHRALEPHTHDFHELFWVEQGRGVHVINGLERPMSAGYLALVRADDEHAFRVARAGETVQFVNFTFPLALWRRVRQGHFQRQRVFFDLPSVREREHTLPPAAVTKLKTLAADLATGHHDALTAETFLLSALTLVRNLTPPEGLKASVPLWLTRVVARVREHPNFTGGVPAMARLAGCSHEYLCRSARKHFNQTPREIVSEARLAHAAVLLASSAYSIADIALECGFGNLGHFYKLFTRQFEMTPSAYRQRHRATVRMFV